MRTIDLTTEAVQINSRVGSVIIQPEAWGTKVRVIADAGSVAELEPPYPLTGYGLTIRLQGKS